MGLTREQGLKNQTDEVAFDSSVGKVLVRDLRYTTDETFEFLKRNTGFDWKKAYDPVPPSDVKGEDALCFSWNKSENIFLNPPFSLARFFVWKLLDQMDTYTEIKRALIILPWYHVDTRYLRPTHWFVKLTEKFQEYNSEIIEIRNATFFDPTSNSKKKITAYAVVLSR